MHPGTVRKQCAAERLRADLPIEGANEITPGPTRRWLRRLQKITLPITTAAMVRNQPGREVRIRMLTVPESVMRRETVIA